MTSTSDTPLTPEKRAALLEEAFSLLTRANELLIAAGLRHEIAALQSRVDELEKALREIASRGSMTDPWPPEVEMRKIARAALSTAERKPHG